MLVQTEPITCIERYRQTLVSFITRLIETITLFSNPITSGHRATVTTGSRVISGRFADWKCRFIRQYGSLDGVVHPLAED